MRTLISFLLAVTTLCVSAQTTSLKSAYEPYFKIGVAVNQRNVTDSAQMELITREFNSVTAENDFKPSSVQPREGQWNWRNADRIADFCRRNGIKLRGHCLAWHNQIGEWMFYETPSTGDAADGTAPERKLVSKEVLFARMRTHIHTVMKRYADIIYCWDVVNEAITDNDHAAQPLRESLFYKICGSDEFIRKAFEYAREAEPNALLFYNDYNECAPGKRERIYNMVKEMKAAGVPIDGIGMQGHYNIYGPSAQEFETAIQRYSEVVDHIHITELDIRCNREMGGQLKFDRNEGVKLTDEQRTRFDSQYTSIFDALRRNAAKIDCVTFWNLSDRDSWLGAANYPLLFDYDYQPKDTYYHVRDFK